MSRPVEGPQFDETKNHSALEALEKRIARLELYLGVGPPLPPSLSTPEKTTAAEEASQYLDQPGIELRFGEFGLPWIGSIIFLLGIVFLMGYITGLGHPTLAGCLGYLACCGLFLLSWLWKRRLSHISFIMLNSSLLLLYYTTLRLRFFSARSLISDPYLALLLLLVVVAVQIHFALGRNSQALAGIAISLGIFSAALADKTHITLPLVALAAVLAVYLLIRRGWWSVLFTTVVLAYASHLLWLLGNPIMGHPVRAVSEHQFNLVYLFLYAAAFSWPALFYKDDSSHEVQWIALPVLNCLGLFSVASLVVFAHFRREFAPFYIVTAVFFLLFSITLWQRTHRELGPAAYACFGYLALSIAIYGYEGIPDGFLWLSLQSLLVVSMALWFRSKILVVLNSLIYVGILLAYVAGSPSSNVANFSFALVAVASARIMNWQKERLTLRTKFLRNVYLSISLVFLLYAIYHAVPSQYVTVSWTLAAVGYFALSLVLKNVKYRWMAMFTLGLSVLYLFLVDLARLDPRFRVAAFLFLGLMALIISLFYSRIRRLITTRTD